MLLAFVFGNNVGRFSDVPSSIIMHFIGAFGVWIIGWRAITEETNQSGDFEIKSRLLKIFFKMVEKPFCGLLALIFIAFGLWEIEYEVPRQSTALRSGVCGFGGIILIFVGQALLWRFRDLAG